MKSLVGKTLALLLVGGLFIIVFGCAQSTDVVQPQINTTITLKPAYLPNLDSIYVYELWMVKVKNPGDNFIASNAEFTSLGKFTYNNATARFMDAAGDSAISNSIDLPETWMNYDYIVVSIENKNDLSPSTPSGTFILSDRVVDPKLRPIALKFPVSMFGALGFYFVGTPTDDTTYWHFPQGINDSGHVVFVRNDENLGLWICSRFRSERPLHDTLAVNDLEVVVVNDQADTTDAKYKPDTIGINFPPYWVVDTTFVVFGLDTLQHRRINIDWIDTVDTNNDYLLFPSYNIDSITDSAYPYPLGNIPYYVYSSPLEGLPDIAPYGWQYNCWVMLEQQTSGDNSGLDLSTVIPFGDGREEDFTGLNSWGILPLGPFTHPDSADLFNPFIDNREVPDFPGNDFVKFSNPANSERYANLNLRRNTLERWGSVLIGMEPDPAKLAVDSTVNFPLFFLSDDLPSASDTAAPYGVQVFHNWSQFLPVINVTVDMHE
jgi:hypothetical protein